MIEQLKGVVFGIGQHQRVMVFRVEDFRGHLQQWRCCLGDGSGGGAKSEADGLL